MGKIKKTINSQMFKGYRSEIENSGIFSPEEMSVICSPKIIANHTFYVDLAECFHPLYPNLSK